MPASVHALLSNVARAQPAAGFDAHKKDEINFRYIGVTERDYEWITEQLVGVANRCGWDTAHPTAVWLVGALGACMAVPPRLLATIAAQTSSLLVPVVLQVLPGSHRFGA